MRTWVWRSRREYSIRDAQQLHLTIDRRPIRKCEQKLLKHAMNNGAAFERANLRVQRIKRFEF